MQYFWLSFILVESFSFLEEFKTSFEICFNTLSWKKIPKNLEYHKIGYFAQFGILGDISGFRQSQISLLIYLLFPVDKSQKLK